MGNATITANLWCDIKMSEIGSSLSYAAGDPIKLYWTGSNAVGWA